MKPSLVCLIAGCLAVWALASTARAQPVPCDPEAGLWCDRVGPTCTSQIPGPGLTNCDVRVANEWSFNEAAYCAGCVYTFYVLVECGREMHLPLSDMEGARITVTEVLSGRPATLRCLNDAAKGNPPTLIRCVGPGGKTGYGPAYDQSTPTGGTLSWGFPDCVSAPDLVCDDIPTGGGPVGRASPGEFQTMDCSVTAPTGLCGLYRVDITSGGFEWKLFANCDGSITPQFDIYFDCAEALAAFDPRPELALANVTAAGNCPAIEATFDVQNLGCADFLGQVPVRLTTSCVPPVVIDVLVDGPIPASGSVSVLVPVDATCNGTVTVTVDPDDTIVECTEASAVASCSQATGVRALQADIACCAATLDPRGADAFGCPGQIVTLDGSASTIAPCASPLYRWRDALGNTVRDWSSVATFSVAPSCPDATYSLDVSCDGEPCIRGLSLVAGCVEPTAAAGSDIFACEGARIVLDGSSSSVTHCAEAEYHWLLGGNEVQPWSPSASLVLDPFTCTQAGTYTLETRCVGFPCAASDDIVVTCAPGPPPPETMDLRVSRAAATVTMTWTPTAGADGHRVLRGSIDSLWNSRAHDHAADALGAGACDAGLGGAFTDPDDGTDSGDWYYLVVAFTNCGGDGPAGFSRIGATLTPRPPRLPTPSCP